jgi:hypothetical protein
VANRFPYIFQIHDNAMWGNRTPRKNFKGATKMLEKHIDHQIQVIGEPIFKL